MAIDGLILDWFLRLHRAGAWPTGNVLEFGPQDLHVSPAIVQQFLARLGRPAESSGGLTAPDVYAALGSREYHALDRDDPRADIRHDLNEPLVESRRFDVITNLGTLEHVFEPGQVFRTTHELLRPGGLAIYVLPAFGDINHGFWNVHPVTYADVARANGYTILDCHYVDNFGVRGERRRETPEHPFEFSALPIKLAEIQSPTFRQGVFLNFLNNAVDPETRRLGLRSASLVFDYCFVAMRKAAEHRPFVRPQQSLYHGS